MIMYPQVHTIEDATLHWSGVEAHQMLYRLTVLSSGLPTKMEDAIHSEILKASHRSHTSLGQSPQLNWRLQSNPQSLRHTPQLNWRLPRITTKAPQSHKT
jgi:hypothetical protein